MMGGWELSVGRYSGPRKPGEGTIGITWTRLSAGWHFGATLGLRWAGVHLAWWRA